MAALNEIRAIALSGDDRATAAELYGLCLGADCSAPDFRKLLSAVEELNKLHEKRSCPELPPPNAEEVLALRRAREVSGRQMRARQRSHDLGNALYRQAFIVCKRVHPRDSNKCYFCRKVGW